MKMIRVSEEDLNIVLRDALPYSDRYIKIVSASIFKALASRDVNAWKTEVTRIVDVKHLGESIPVGVEKNRE